MIEEENVACIFPCDISCIKIVAKVDVFLSVVCFSSTLCAVDKLQPSDTREFTGGPLIESPVVGATGARRKTCSRTSELVSALGAGFSERTERAYKFPSLPFAMKSAKFDPNQTHDRD